MERQDYIELLHTDLDAVAQSYAQGLHENVAVAMEEGMNDALDTFLAEADEELLAAEDASDLIVPGLKHRVYDHLARHCEKTSTGWCDVFFTNLEQQYGDRSEP